MSSELSGVDLARQALAAARDGRRRTAARRLRDSGSFNEAIGTGMRSSVNSFG